MLTMSVLFIADFFDLRGDDRFGEREARKSIAEALAVQLSTLASVSDRAGIRFSISSFVSRNQSVVAAALVTAEGESLAEFGDLVALEAVSAASTLAHITVPIFNANQPWGEVKIAFASTRRADLEFRYFTFIVAGCFLLYLLFLRKALAQLDPGRVVPGRVNSAFNLLSEGVVILDDQLRILLANDSMAEALNKSKEELVGQRLDDWSWQRSDDWQAPWATALQSGLNVANQPLNLILDDDRTQVFMVSCAAVGNESEGVRGVMVTLDDMTAIEQKNRELAVTLRQLRRSQESISRKNKELEALATQDPLTGLANRRALLANFEREYAKAGRESRALSCIMIDIDYFKKINDSFGHGVGDEVICAVGNTLVAQCREYDTVGRYGGEEFVVVLPDMATAEAEEIAERLRAAVQGLGSDVTVPVDKLSASFGVASLKPDVRDLLDLLDQADQALYAAKQGGRNRVVVYDPKVIKLEAANPAETVSAPPEETLSRVVELEAIVDQRTRDLEQLREYDSLTGIPKRALFLQRIETELLRAKRTETKVGLMSIEIKDLNRLVGTFGHAACDRLIVEVIERLQEGLRSTDAVSEITDEHSLSRITSNEYGVLLADLEKYSNSMPVVTRLRRLLTETFIVGGQKVYVGVNIGIALSSEEDDSAVKLLASAGSARVLASKDPAKVSHSFASQSLDQDSKAYIQLESDLFEACESGDFEVYYQPMLDLAKQRIGGAEALVRWRHPTRGFISPEEFIPIAESNGLIQDLSAFVLAKAVAQLATWRAMGWTELKMSVNVSPVQLRSRTLVSDLLAALAKHEVPADRLEVELTESSIIESPQRARVTLGRMREAGMRVSMDDFGTGYSSLSLLADLPLDAVKIDRSFVDAMLTSQRSRAIVESVVNMAQSLQLHVVGEGIETNEQLAVLTSLGCNEIQGYLISRPMPADEVTEFLKQQSRDEVGAAY
ncbi:MAG: EAL domain-containing protein [Pseudomonadales bacterium]